ncbi:carbamoyltransferase family protein [Flavobacterium daejeonense]|uniref:carbamoyltransferase family protein n=1 Tax=Flavobacterium daejeonense TaxID=350893 RepID=UPI00047C0D87|nr:carbamoyltransferase C-terminal domain-containing protein [Flavobacterium daejeonense]
MKKPIYILGTGLSHNGSAVLLKDGKICVAIEKERLSRIKHDGGNDTLAIQYCLEAEGIDMSAISLVVQCANFDIPDPKQFHGKRIFSDANSPKIVTISHHLAHAYSTVGTSPFSECAVMIIDGCGSPLSQHLELHPEEQLTIRPEFIAENKMMCEKDSFYHFQNNTLTPLFKDFSEMDEINNAVLAMATTKHSIGGFYAAISKYVFGDLEDVGKLMGLAPFGKSNCFDCEAFEFRSECLFVKEDWKENFVNPSKGYEYFLQHFSYYANVARWAQEQVEKAVLSCLNFRMERFPHENLSYSGGVALNAVANAKLEDSLVAKNIFFEPAAGDNGLALGCAFYGWISHFGKEKLQHDGSTCFGKQYSQEEIDTVVKKEINEDFNKQFGLNDEELLAYCAAKLNEGKTIGWFQSGSEFGPRSLGRRSILAHPGVENMKNHINRNIKFREDFRPFAPAVLKDKVKDYFEKGRNSPYMILIDKTRPEYLQKLRNVTHCDGTARVQTVDASWNSKFARLIEAFYKQSGIAVLLNTSFNKKGMPMVESPLHAVELFKETALDILVMENTIIEKR